MVRELMALPETLDWVPGLVTDEMSTFQVSVTEPAAAATPLLPPAAPAVSCSSEPRSSSWNWRPTQPPPHRHPRPRPSCRVRHRRCRRPRCRHRRRHRRGAASSPRRSALPPLDASSEFPPRHPLWLSPLPPEPPPLEVPPSLRHRPAVAVGPVAARYALVDRCSRPHRRHPACGRRCAVRTGTASATAAGHGHAVEQVALPRHRPDAPPPAPAEDSPSTAGTPTTPSRRYHRPRIPRLRWSRRCSSSRCCRLPAAAASHRFSR